MKTSKAGAAWFKSLKAKDKAKVRQWIKDNPPGKDWQATRLDHAFLQMFWL